MRTVLNGNGGSPESQLLARIEQELATLSERQHATARRITRLREVRTHLHLGCSALAASAMLAEQNRKEAAHAEPAWPTVADEPLDAVPAMDDLPAWNDPMALREAGYRRGRD